MNQLNPQTLPDISRMNDLKEDFLKQLYRTTGALLPALREQLTGLSERLLDTDRLLSERVLSALVLVGNHKWGDLAPVLAQNPGQVQVLEQDALRDRQRLQAKGQEIVDALAQLGKARLPAVQERVDALADQRDTLNASIASQEARIEGFNAQIEAMSEVINAFEVPDLQRVFKGMVPTEAEIALIQKMLVKGVDPDSLMAAARIFVDKVAGLLEGRKLSGVIKLRMSLVIERGVLLDEVCNWKARRAAVESELAELPGVAALGGVRDQWLENAGMLARGWTERVEAVSVQTELQAMADALCAMEAWLLAVRRRYEEL
ncbi:alpha-xenorhabdolysin family binary toxin subunit B [Pseudomonas sp. GD04058]|uniref:alpha-xenorhabdolysin family binary toxin subunit B n=1 Tax=Pseudomonas sp. GD04058 TaxID=2975429 RepID=UPI002449A09C|nr:alpha-xenorhabdolysin family binary toxin subunit B [Pseudomonas sp. GD04058]MDG9884994.1 alpha-xenorhabdolysin family binary toxin subunit B [Pseudomonas sp. GD04058]